MKKKIEMEKEELQASLEESEAALEVRNGKRISYDLYKSNSWVLQEARQQKEQMPSFQSWF